MNIEWLKNKLGEKFYPITHVGSVLCGDSNETLETKLLALDESIGAKANASDLTEHTENTNNPHNVTAEQTPYDHTESGLSAQNVQDAVDEVNDNFNNLEIGGRNLYLGTKDFSGNWYKDSLWRTYSETYKGFTVKKRTGSFNGLYQIIQADVGDVLTFSGYVKKDSSGTMYVFAIDDSDKEHGTAYPINKTFTVEANTWTRVSFTFKVTVSGKFAFRFENPEEGIAIYVCGLKLERGNKPTDWTPAPEDIENEIQSVEQQVTTNLLKPTLQTETQNGVTCTNNGDGTYTLNGTASANAVFKLSEFNVTDSVKMVGCPKDGSLSTFKLSAYANQYPLDDIGNGTSLDIHIGKTVEIRFVVYSGTTIVNKVFKPMLTTNLNATYDDFVPFTGTTGKLNGDVAEIEKSNDGKMNKENPTGTGAFSMNRKADTTVGENSTTEGSNCEASAICSHAEGKRTTASGSHSHAEGNATTASGNYSHSEGSGAKASGESSHAEGIGTVSSNTASHAEGYGTTASSPHSHAEGFQTFAKNTASHAEGYCTEAYGKYSHTGGNKTVAWYQSQTAIGEYNENKEGNLFEVGNGTSDTDRSNALELNKYGDLIIEGDFIDGYGNKLSEAYAKHTLVDYYDESTLTKNCFLLGGNTISNTYWSISGYIPCCNGDIVYGASNNSSNNLPVISLYDKDKNWIKDVLYSGINYFQWKVEIDDVNAKYFRANIASLWFGASNENQYLIVERGNRDSEIIVTVDKNKSIDTLNATTFVKGLSIAYNLGNCKLLVEAGVYDIISELGQLVISTEDGGGLSEENWGLLIGNNVRVIGNGNVKLTANYTGSSKNVTDYFSILNSTGSFELNEINMECQNVRYCLHEDIAGITTEPPSTSAKVINCNMKHKGTVSTTYSAPCCIGAGTSYNESVSIEGGYYSSPSSYPYPISYHNGFNSGNTAILRLSNVKFADGNTLRLFGFVENGSFVDVYLNNFSLDIHYEGAVDRFNVYN